MLLLELNGRYFWIASKELRGEPFSPDNANGVSALAWRIADKLREADDVPYFEEILTVLMKEDAYKTADHRAAALDEIIKRIGGTVNPRYAKAIQKISTDNLRGFGTRPPGHRNNAPGLLGIP